MDEEEKNKRLERLKAAKAELNKPVSEINKKVAVVTKDKKREEKLPVIKKAEKSNNVKDIVDSEVVDEVIAELVTDSKDKQLDKFLLLWLLGFSAKAAALSAGYSQSYSESGVQRRLKTPKLRERIEEITSVMPEKYRSLCRLRLTDVAEVEGEVLKEMKLNPNKAIRNPQVLKQIKQSAGALADESQPPQSIHIETLQVIQQNQLSTMSRRLEEMEKKPKIVDVTRAPIKKD